MYSSTQLMSVYIHGECVRKLPKKVVIQSVSNDDSSVKSTCLSKPQENN